MFPDARKKRILVVEDEPDTRIFLTTLLESGGFEPISTGGSTDGLHNALAVRPDLIILDIMIADERGILIYKWLKGDRRLRRVPVIMLSAIDKKTFFHYQRFQSMFSGRGIPEPEAYLEKPAEADDLLRLVGTLSKKVERRGPEGRLGQKDRAGDIGMNEPQRGHGEPTGGRDRPGGRP